VRCYYGGVSVALGGFLALLLAEDQADLALSGVLILASTVLLCRLVSTLVDGGRDHPYTRVAIPSEALMVLGLGAAKLLG
jgi:multisubunit Na+/H+ antiporter MnhB subunit